ncbi:MAG TPA: pitrilysin family protein, partial [Candidatus Udaeobacter sp.]|nr:pitrilysin family protein [Candidatus Udaeobacter sp.]
MDVIGDCLSHSLFNPEHIAREKLVATEEIQSYEDSPDEHIQDLVSECVWRGHPLGTPILGTRETVAGFNAQNVREYFTSAYHSGQTVIAAAGNLTHEALVELAAEHLDLPASPAAGSVKPVPLTYAANDHAIERDIAQLNLCLGAPGLAYSDPRRPALMVLNGILGGAMSSRIFQRVREDEGLAYSVFTDVDCHHDSGIFVCGMAVSPPQGKRAVKLVGEEFRRLVKDGLAPGELADMKSQFRGNILLGLESTGTRMGRLAKSLIYYGRPVPVEELLKRVDAVTEEEVIGLGAELLKPERFSLIALGPLPGGTLHAAELL